MTTGEPILEHELLGILFINTSLSAGVPYTVGAATVPIFERNYLTSVIHISTLIHILNNPDLYKDEKSVQQIKITENILYNSYDKYTVAEILLAIGNLESNSHVNDIFLNPDQYGRFQERKIQLTKEGANAYRANYYKKEQKREYLALNQMESVIETNQSVKTTNKVQILSLIVTAIFIIVGVKFQNDSLEIAQDQYILDKSRQLEDRKLKVSENQTKEELLSLKNHLSATQKQIDSLITASKRRSPHPKTTK